MSGDIAKHSSARSKLVKLFLHSLCYRIWCDVGLGSIQTVTQAQKMPMLGQNFVGSASGKRPVVSVDVKDSNLLTKVTYC